MTPGATKMQPARRRGRPSEVDPREVAKVALREFEARGVDEVTMDEVAKAAGISRRTLFRLFPSKTDLVWEGLDQMLAATRQRIEALGSVRRPLHEVVERVLFPTLALLDDPEWASLARRRLKLIASSLALLNHRTMSELQALLTEAIARTVEPLDQPASLVANTLVSVGFSSILWWATTGSQLAPADALRASFAAVALATPLRRP